MPVIPCWRRIHSRASAEALKMAGAEARPNGSWLELPLVGVHRHHSVSIADVQFSHMCPWTKSMATTGQRHPLRSRRHESSLPQLVIDTLAGWPRKIHNHLRNPTYGFPQSWGGTTAPPPPTIDWAGYTPFKCALWSGLNPGWSVHITWRKWVEPGLSNWVQPW